MLTYRPLSRTVADLTLAAVNQRRQTTNQGCSMISPPSKVTSMTRFVKIILVTSIRFPQRGILHGLLDLP